MRCLAGRGDTATLVDGDILVLAQKIVSKAEGRLLPLASVEAGAAARALAEETGKVLRAPGLREKLLQQGAEPVGSMPDDFAAFFRADYARWGALVKQNGLKAE